MSDLREKQKRKREEAIIKAAMTLLGEKGYRNTSIEEIARVAEVGPATVYNYFNSKSELFLSIISREAESALAKGEKIIGKLPEKAEDAVFALVQAYFSIFARHYPKQLVREIIVILFIEQISVRKKLLGMDYAVVDQIIGLLNKYKELGQLKPTLDATEAANAVYAMIMGDAIAFVVDDDMTLKSYLGIVKSQIHLLFGGFAPAGAG